MFLFIFESISTPEVILIAVVALIIFGPRKLPQMAKTIGKTMQEFRNATNEFKSTWEKEVAFEDEKSTNVNSLLETPITKETSVLQDSVELHAEKNFPTPQVKELSAEEISQNFQNNEAEETESQPTKIGIEKINADKREWL